MHFLLFLLSLMVTLVPDHKSFCGKIGADPLKNFRSQTRGAEPLRLLGPTDPLPDLESAYNSKDQNLLLALDRSIEFFSKPINASSYEPFAQYTTWENASKGLILFKHLLTTSPNAEAFAKAVREQFSIWQSVGSDGKGQVLFTGYITPILEASHTRDGEFNVPIYKRPANAVMRRNMMVGRREKGEFRAMPTRAEVYAGNYLKGEEIGYLRAYDLFLLEINGSAQLSFRDGHKECIGFSTRTKGQLLGLRKLLIDNEFLTEQATWHDVRIFADQHPEVIELLLLQNTALILYAIFPCASWPLGSTQVPLTELASIATDKGLFPPGSLALVSTTISNLKEERHPFTHFMLDQDTGSAIQGPGHVDIYMGSTFAGQYAAYRETAIGTLYYFFLKAS